MIFDSAGNAVEAFDTDRDAMRALLLMVREDRDAARHLAILTFDSDGEAVGDPITVADLMPEMATEVILTGAWSRHNRLTFISRGEVGAAAPQRTLTTGQASS
jgi:hypothetical protein